MQSGGRARRFGMALTVTAVMAAFPAQFGGTAAAGTIDIWSQPGSGTNNITGGNTAILASPVWAAPTNSQYEWISYTDTGCNFFSVTTGRCTPGVDNPVGTPVTGPATATFYQTFTLANASVGTLEVWADDTAGVWLDTGTVSGGDGSSGSLLIAPNANLGSNCGNAPIGCLPGMDAVLPLALGPGTYTVVIDAYQLVGGSPFGVMYNGVLHDGSPSVPEPSTYMLMGVGLAGLAAIARRRKHA